MNIQHNLMAMNANRQRGNIHKSQNTWMERLSSGYRINRASDDAAGMAISEKMRAQIRGLNRASMNVEEGMNFVQIADAALDAVHEMLHRIHELSVQASNDTYVAADRIAINMEIQAIKKEMERIFEGTEYNTIPIWNTNTPHKVQIGAEYKQAVKLQNLQGLTEVTNVNKGAVAWDGHSIDTNGFYQVCVKGIDETDASTYGFTMEWDGWNGNHYTTDLIFWDDVLKKSATSYQMHLKEHISDEYLAEHPEIEGIDFQFDIRWLEQATLEDISKGIDGASAVFHTESREKVTKLPDSVTETGASELASNIRLSGVTTCYLAEMAADRDAEHYDTEWIQAGKSGGNVPNIVSMPSYTDINEETGWSIKFYMPGIGAVTAELSSVSWTCGDRSPSAEKVWWDWHYVNKTKKDKIGNTYYAADGKTLKGVMEAIMNENGHSLVKDASVTSGTIGMHFNMTSDTKYKYGEMESNAVGGFDITVSVSHNNVFGAENAVQEQEKLAAANQLMEDLKNALNSQTILDIYEGVQESGEPDKIRHSSYNIRENTLFIEIPKYKSAIKLWIQEGANAGQGMNLAYDSLRLINLGLDKTNVLTREDAQKAIKEVLSAEKIVSEQRSYFGACQNRFLHAKDVDDLSAENLQTAESQIRDMDMAKAMVENAKLDILEQAGMSMLVQTNRIQEGILQLLR